MTIRTHFFGAPIATFATSAGRAAVEFPCDIEDALHWHLNSTPGSAWIAEVQIIGADTDAPRMVCKIGMTVESWPILQEDVPTAAQVIADVIAEVRDYQERPS